MVSVRHPWIFLDRQGGRSKPNSSQEAPNGSDRSSNIQWRRTLRNQFGIKQWPGGAGRTIKYTGNSRSTYCILLHFSQSAQLSEGTGESINPDRSMDGLIRRLATGIPSVWVGLALSEFHRRSQTGSFRKMQYDGVVFPGSK